MPGFLARVERAIRQHHLLPPGEPVLLGVSGGVDSMVLMHLLRDLAPAYHWRLVVAHYNHRYRGAESDADAELVKSTADSLGLEQVTGVNDSPPIKGISLEMAARRLRHAFLAEVAREKGIARIAVAHQADDQLELFFLRLFRGTSSLGAGGMRWLNRGFAKETWIVRPLLGERKDEIQSYARQKAVPFRDDASNTDRSHLRNRVRHDLMPFLKAAWGPQAETNILRTMEILAGEAEWMEQAARAWAEGGRTPPFASLPPAMQRHGIRLALEGQKIVPSYQLIEKLRTAPGTRQVAPGGLGLQLAPDGRIERVDAPRKPSFNPTSARVILKGSKGSFAFAGLQVNWRITPEKGTAAVRNRKSALFDPQNVGETVSLRHWQPGDRFQPLGFKQPSRLQNLFTNRKIGRDQRRELVVAVAANGRLFWVEGLPPSELFKVTGQTSRRLQWSWKRTAATSKTRKEA